MGYQSITESESTLLLKLKQGDLIVYREIFDTYYRPLTIFALHIVNDLEDAKEIVQEFFIKLWEIKEQLDIQSSFKGYLFACVKNASLNYKAQRDNRTNKLNTYKPKEVDDDLFEQIVAIETEELIYNAIASLPERCRDIFKLSRFEGLTYNQIADKLEISVKTVETQIGIALRKLKGYRYLLISLFVSFLEAK